MKNMISANKKIRDNDKVEMKSERYSIKGVLGKLRGIKNIVPAIAMGVLVVGLAAGVALVQNTQDLRKYASSNDVDIDMPKELEVLPGETVNVPVMLKADELAVMGVTIELYLSGDKDKFEIVNVIVGDILPIVLSENGQPEVSNSKVTMTLVAECTDELNCAGYRGRGGVLATVVVRAVSEGDVELKIRKDKTIIVSRDESVEYDENVLGSVDSTKIVANTITNGNNGGVSPTVVPTITAVWSTAPTKSVTSIVVSALGTVGNDGKYPRMQLLIKELVVGTWEVTNGFADYTYNTNEEFNVSDVKVKFINDDGPKNLRVDYIKLNDATYQTEASTTFSTGTWSPDTGCDDGYKKSEWLKCNGYFHYTKQIPITGARPKRKPTPTPTIGLRPWM